MYGFPLVHRRAATSIGLAGLAAATMIAAAPAAPAQTSAPAGQSAPGHGHRNAGLGDVAARRRLLIGTAVNTDVLASDPTYAQVLAHEFTSVTPENVMKWQLVEPTRGTLDFTAADNLVRFARQHHQIVRGHTLVWHNQLPDWLTSGTFTNAELEAILHQHITDEMRHFRGRIYAWDVVNEAFNEDGTMRDTIWLRALGPDYIAKAFTWAHQADPHARLYYNDFNLESVGPKSDAVLAMVKNLKSRHIPIDGVGFQGHLDIQFPFPDTFGANLKRFAAARVDVAITEADVRMFVPPDATKVAAQNTFYTNMMSACLAVRRCVSFTIWGLDDGHSWIPGFFTGEGSATLFDEAFQPKADYVALRTRLRQRLPGDAR